MTQTNGKTNGNGAADGLTRFEFDVPKGHEDFMVGRMFSAMHRQIASARSARSYDARMRYLKGAGLFATIAEDCHLQRMAHRLVSPETDPILQAFDQLAEAGPDGIAKALRAHPEKLEAMMEAMLSLLKTDAPGRDHPTSG